MNYRTLDDSLTNGKSMYRCIGPLMAFFFLLSACVTNADVGWQTLSIHDHFHAEGASSGDINNDGHTDIVAGPFWYAGPTFKSAKPITEPKTFPITAYSDQFFSKVVDVNADGRLDVIVIGFPGKEARLYVNPGADKLDRPWPEHTITGAVDNESAEIVDLIEGGLPEIVCGRDGQYGYYSAGPDATEPWAWIPISRPEASKGKFAHALGVGDVDRDGQLDVIDKSFWWKQPAGFNGTESTGKLWQAHQWTTMEYGGGAQIGVADIDGDGDSDIVTSLAAHGYGLAWFEQIEPNQFAMHSVLGSSSLENPYGVCFSQLHAVRLADIDGDGVQDIVTGKRWMAHKGKDVGGLQEPVLYWFQCVRGDAGVEFVPHLIHSDSGVGVDVLVTDVNGDDHIDVVSASKRGLSVHLQFDANSDDANSINGPQRWRVTQGRDLALYVDGRAPEDAASNMLVPGGFSVDLIASEPELTQPIAMCFDARGRIWVVEGHSYPVRASDGQGQDRILILEDADGNGSYETRKVFMEGLNLVSGIEIGFGGVWIGAAPQLLFIPDADRDDIPDGEPQVLLDGWAFYDTHETLNSFTWGPDGWLYGCHGVFNESNVGKPGSAEDQRERINAGVWRYHPTRQEFEVFAHGTSNPWGVDFNDRGDWFVTACVIEHLFHIQQGARYKRQSREHFNPYTYDDIKTIADHKHYHGEKIARYVETDYRIAKADERSKVFGAALNTSMVGGGHAHCGLAIYNGSVFPRQYHGQLLFHNLHGHRVVCDALEDDGSGYIARHRPDFALSQDHQQIGVGIMVGPDGAIYTSDWHDPQTCHQRDPEVWDRTNGRLFRIRYGNVQPQTFNLWKETDARLVTRLSSNNGFFARQAARLLQERSVAGSLDRASVTSSLRPMLASGNSTRDRLRAMWMLSCIGVLNEGALVGLLGDDDAYIRGWALQFLGESKKALSRQAWQAVVTLAKTEKSAVTRRYLASLLQRIPLDQRLPIIAALTANRIDQYDRNLPWLIWYAMEPLVPQQPVETLDLARESGWPTLLRFTVRRLSVTSEGRDRLVAQLTDSAHKSDRLMILEELLATAKSRGGVKMPDQWQSVFTNLVHSSDGRVQQLARAVAVQFGDKTVQPFFREVLADLTKAKSVRSEALTALHAIGDQGLSKQLFGLLDDRAIAADVASMLGRLSDPQTPSQLISRLDGFDEPARIAALNTLVSRKEYGLRLTEAMESGAVASTSVPAFIIRQLIAMDDPVLTERLEKTWGKIGVSSADKNAQYDKYRRLLRGGKFRNANLSRGRVLYEANCGKCHKLFGVGGDIGPDITGANRTNLEYWLENIIEPNALIGRGYLITRFLLNDGRIVAGLVKQSNDSAVTVQTATEQVVIARDDIEEEVPSDVSLMPEGQLEPMTDDQVRELFRYLQSPTQVELPAE